MKYKDFQYPDREFYPRPLWFWNDRPTEEALADIMDTAEEKSAYGGFGILSYEATELAYMGEEYLNTYEFVLKKAEEKNLKLCLYDEWWFPSGSAGGLLKQRYPEACAKRLDKVEYEASGHVEIALPGGKLMAAVAMNMETRQILNLRENIQGENLVWDAEGDNWKVMLFSCVLSDWDNINYLDPEAVKKFIEVTHEAYYARFGKYFGSVIDSSFYDEPQMYAVGGRMWVDNFNELFMERYGFAPDVLYPALWYDIGENTASARSMLHGLRSDLYAEGFPKVLQEWCTKHQIQLTGHVDQEEMINPTGIVGDLMKSSKYQDIPGFDEIAEPGRGSKIYKIVSSAANNWDKPLVMSECYGAMKEDTSIETMYNEAMEQYVKGMNHFVPHAVWLNPDKEKIIFHPELSYRNERYQGTLKPFNEYCARMSKLLKGGRHVADIAVLYPIYGLNASYYFDWGDPYLGGPAPEYFDYQEIGNWLSGTIRKDFTFLHPEVLDEKCTVKDGELCLNNLVNHEEYKVVILPGTNTMSLRNLQKIQEFVDQGGTVIATSMIPVHSAEAGKDQELKEILQELFGQVDSDADYTVKNGEGRGSAWFIPRPNAKLLAEVLEKTGVEFDVCLTEEKEGEGLVTYLHKEKDGRDIYYIVNCNSDWVQLDVSIRTEKELEIWDAHDGTRSELDGVIMENGRMNFPLSIMANHSLVLVSKE